MRRSGLLARSRGRGGPIDRPGTGYDGLVGTDVVGRDLTPAQVAEASRFREQLEASRKFRGGWTGWAAQDTARFAGTPLQKAQLYAEFLRQMMQTHRGWYAHVELGRDGSYIFTGTDAIKKTFVVAPDGTCYKGSWDDIPGAPGARTPNYATLQRVDLAVPGGGPPRSPAGGGGGGVAPPGGGAPPEPAKAGAAASEPAKGGRAGSPTVAAGAQAEAGLGAGLRFTAKVAINQMAFVVAVTVFLSGIRAWLGYEKNVETEEERRVKQVLAKHLSPGVAEAMQQRAGEAEALTAEHPELTLYANVTADFDYTWTESGIAGNPTEKALGAARFVGLELSWRKVATDVVIEGRHRDGPDYAETHRVTYSVPVEFDETPAQRQWRTFLKQARDAARRGLSARAVAGHSHFTGVWTQADEREEGMRQKFGLPSLREQRQRDLRKLWVKAYVEYTAFHGPDDQYAAALRYLAELEKLDAPAPAAPGFAAPASKAERERMRDFLGV